MISDAPLYYSVVCNSVPTVDREIFAIKIIRGLNFCIKNILSLDSSAT